MTDTIAYLRVSTEDQASERKTSLVDQRAAIEQLAAQLGRIVGEYFEDAGVSGGKEDRPGFQALLRHCEAHPRVATPGLVLVLNDSRWSRLPDPDMATYWRMHVQRLGWHVRFVENHVEDVAMRSVMRSLHQTQATIYRENLRANVRRGARGQAAKGLWQNEAPFGYRRCATNAAGVARVLAIGQRKAEDEVSRLVFGPPEEVQLVRELFERYAAGSESQNRLAYEMAQRWPAKQWSSTSLKALLSNPAYMGDVVWCRRPIDPTGSQKRDADPQHWVVVRDAHPAIVSRDLFAAVQRRRSLNARDRRSVLGGYPLSGMITCSACGSPLFGGGGRRGPVGDPDRYRFYRDAGAYDRPSHPAVCTRPSATIGKTLLERGVINAIADVISTQAAQLLIQRELDRHLGAAAATPKTTPARRRSQLEAERARLVGAIARGVLTDDDAAPELERIRVELLRAAENIPAAFSENSKAALRLERDRLLQLALNFRGLAAAASGPHLRALLKPWIARAVFEKSNRKVRLYIRRVPMLGLMTEGNWEARG